MEISIPSNSLIQAQITDDNFYFNVGAVRIIVHRDQDSNKKLLMDFTVYNLSAAGNSHTDEIYNLKFASNPHFDGGVVNQEGYLLKIERDIFLMSSSMNDGFNTIN